MADLQQVNSKELKQDLRDDRPSADPSSLLQNQSHRPQGGCREEGKQMEKLRFATLLVMDRHLQSLGLNISEAVCDHLD